MVDPRTPPPRRSVAPWPLVIAAAAVILAALWFFMASDVEEPVPTPDSPAATGTAGEPAGTTGASPQPGAPVGADAPPGSGTVAPAN